MALENKGVGFEDSPLREQANNRATEVVHAQLRKAILRGELRAGTCVGQEQLAARFGVSRTPLRQALKLLQGEGLVEVSPSRRVRVAGFSIQDLEQVYFMRIVLEAAAIRLTVPLLGEDEIEEAKRNLWRMGEFSELEDYDRWEEPHRAFHFGLVSRAGDRALRTIHQLYDHAERYRRIHASESPRAWSRGTAEHEALLNACEVRDTDLAAELLARHYSTVVLSLVAALAPEHEPSVVRTALRSVMRRDGSGEVSTP